MDKSSILKRLCTALTLALLVAAGPALARSEDGKLVVGITLHPYYSFVANIVQDRAMIVPLISAGSNPHGYQPEAEDIKRAMGLDVLVVNAVGHDEWAYEIIAAASRSADLPLIEANASVALIPVAGDHDAKVVNPHTFISTNASIQQVYEIARRLAEMDPQNADFYITNARQYGQKIRALRAEFTQRIAALDTSNFHAASMHAGYDYLFQELGLAIDAVIEPRHGVNPTARQLAQTVDEIKAAGVNVLFAEKYFAGNLAETIQAETGVKVYSISHISSGPYTAEKFEVEMRENLATVVEAIEGTMK